MNKNDLVRKLTSRKLWVSICGFISLLVVALGYTDAVASQVSAIIMAGATVVGYAIGEGLADSSTTDTSSGDSKNIEG